MSARTDPAAVFRQEAAELLEQLELALLDLSQRPDDRALVDTSFRAMHTIKGSGAMFGFKAVSAFVHDFETAFDRVRRGLSRCTPALVTAALEARDHIRALIEQPDQVDAARGDALLAALRQAVAGAELDAAAEAPPAAGWRVRFHLDAEALVNGTNPLRLLEEFREMGEARVTALTDAIPPLDELDPEQCHLGWEVEGSGGGGWRGAPGAAGPHCRRDHAGA